MAFSVLQDGRCRRPQLDPPDLSSRGGRIGVDEYHSTGPFERGQPVAAEGDEVVLGCRPVGGEDHEGDRLLQAVRIDAGHHDGLPDRVVSEQPRLHLGGRHPDAAGLEHVAGAAEAGVEAVRVSDVRVAGAHPLAGEDLSGGGISGPVSGRRRVGAHHERPRLAVGSFVTAFVNDTHLIAGDRNAGRAGADLAGPVGQEDVQRFGHPDAVDDVDAEPIGPAVVKPGRQRFAGRDGEPDTGEDIGGQVRAEHVGEERRAGEEEGRAVLSSAGRDAVRPGGRGFQYGRCPDREGEEQRVAQAVREEALGRRQGPIVSPDPEHLAAVALTDDGHGAVPVHGRLRRSGGAGCVQPECGRVRDGRVHPVDRRSGPHQLVQLVQRKGCCGLRIARRSRSGHAVRALARRRPSPHRRTAGRTPTRERGSRAAARRCLVRAAWWRPEPGWRQCASRPGKSVTKSGESATTISSRCSGRRPSSTRTDEVRRTESSSSRIAQVPTGARQREAIPVAGSDAPIEQILTGVEQLRTHRSLPGRVVAGSGEVHVLVLERLSVDAVARWRDPGGDLSALVDRPHQGSDVGLVNVGGQPRRLALRPLVSGDPNAVGRCLDPLERADLPVEGDVRQP